MLSCYSSYHYRLTGVGVVDSIISSSEHFRSLPQWSDNPCWTTDIKHHNSGCFIASPDTAARCSCRSRRQRCRTGRGRTRSSSRGTLAIHLNDDGELKSGFVPLTWAGEEGGGGGEECRQEERGARHDQALCWQARTLLQRYYSYGVVTAATLFQI